MTAWRQQCYFFAFTAFTQQSGAAMSRSAAARDQQAYGRQRRSAPCPPKRLREFRMSRYRQLKIEGGAFFCTLALADRRRTANQLSERFGA
jgi:hypothetical protein